MNKATIRKQLTKLVKLTEEAIIKAEKRGDARVLARLIREQRHNLKALRK